MASTGTADAQALPELDNGQVRVAFNPSSGHLTGFADVRNGYEFIDPAYPAELWQIDLLPPSEKDVIAPTDAREFRWAAQKDAETALELEWRSFNIPEAPELRVKAEVSLDKDDSAARWRFTVEGTENLNLAAVHFPRIASIAPQEDEVLAVPIWMGEKMNRPRNVLCGDSPKQLEWENPGLLSLQCLAFYRQDGPGLYIATDDTAAHAKRFRVFGVRQTAGMEVCHLPGSESEHAARYETPYHVITGAFVGDWFTVAERYRRWALEQPCAASSRLATGAVADWVTKTGLWIWNRGPSDGVLDPAIALQERTGLPVSVFWHWWHGCAYDTGFPEYLPPREGAEPFKTALGRAHEAGVHAIVYMNQRLWGMTTRSWTEEGAERFAVKNPDGTVRPEVYNTFNKAPCASMCMGTPFWRNKYAGLAEQAVMDLGVDGIYMDQACSSLACYDPSHGHPLGGGTYWMQGFQALQANIRARCGSARPVTLAGEGCGEAWLPYLDLMLSLQVSMERYAAPGVWEPIPFFHAVYHGRAVFFGNYSSLTMPPYDNLWPAEFAPAEPLKLLDRKFAQQFRIEQARAFVWGQQPTIANFRPAHLESRAEEIDYAVRLAKLRLHALKYLLYGTMLRPPEVNLPGEEIDISRLSIYAGQQDALKQYRKPVPPVLASAWKAPDGDVCIVAANITDQPQHFEINLKETGYPISSPEEVLNIHLEPAGARIYEFKPLLPPPLKGD